MKLEVCHEGIVLSVRAVPGAKRNEIRFGKDGGVKICVTQIPEKGKATEAVRKLLAESLNLRASQVELLQGETSPQKKFLLRDVCAEEIQKRLSSAQDG